MSERTFWIARGDGGYIVGEGNEEIATVKSRDDALLFKAAPRLVDALRDLSDYAAECAADRDERPPCVDAARVLLAELGAGTAR